MLSTSTTTIFADEKEIPTMTQVERLSYLVKLFPEVSQEKREDLNILLAEWRVDNKVVSGIDKGVCLEILELLHSAKPSMNRFLLYLFTCKYSGWCL